MDSPTEMKTEIVTLKEDIARLHDRVITEQSPRPLPRSPSSISLKTPPIKSRFSRLRAPFRRISSAGNKKSSRDDPGSSTEALVEPIGKPLPIQRETKTAGDLLSLLAPLVSRLQALGRSLRESIDLDDQVAEDFRTCCTDLEACIALFTTKPAPDAVEGETDIHDNEMKSLLLEALTKKIIHERSSLPAHSPALSRASSGVRDASPFVLHSSDVLGPRRPSTPESGPRSIPIGVGRAATSAGHLGPYPSFADAGQHTGLANVFRLGSFQNSLLFSPSPVAVRPPLVTGGMRM